MVHGAVELVMCMCDISGHMGRHIDGYDGIHGGSGVVIEIWKEECY